MEKNFFTLIRSKILVLPTGVVKEVMLEIVNRLHAQRVPRATLARIVWFIATARPHKHLQVNKRLELFATQTTVVVQGK